MADTYPNPILKKTYFTSPQLILTNLQERPHEYGIGQTCSRAGYGMAALEGVVAALEVSCTFLGSYEEGMGVPCQWTVGRECSRGSMDILLNLLEDIVRGRFDECVWSRERPT